MKRLFKWLPRIAAVIVGLILLLALFKDSFLRILAERRIRDQTGMDVKIGKFSAGLFSPVITIEDFKLYNTPEFGSTLFLDVPELRVEVDKASLTEGKLRISLIRLNLAELDIVRNQAGHTNIVNLFTKMEPAPAKTNRLQKWSGELEFVGIDVLDLTLGKAKFIDLKNAGNNRELVLNLQNQIFRNVKSEAHIQGILFMLWLRTGGNISLMPGNSAETKMESLEVRAQTIETNGLR
jgi:uncharacterized protein involved in outer membrane biogenesis